MGRKIPLERIQPVEDYVVKESVEYFLEYPYRLFQERPQIRILVCEGQPFQFCAANGNSRLYVCYKLGITDIPIVPGKSDASITEIARERYDKCIRNWSDFDSRIITREERGKLYFGGDYR